MGTAAALLPQSDSTFHFHVEVSEQEDGLAAFISVRPRLLAIAYRMLGNVMAAEDVVQDAWLRWQTSNRRKVENPSAFLATITTRLCLNLVQSAHVRRETSIGNWLMEPVDTGDDPAAGAEQDERLKLGLIVLLAKLTPTERAAYVLREAFDYSYGQIAHILRMAEANVRKLVSRASKRIVSDRSRPVSSYEQRRFLEAFTRATRKGNMGGLERLLAEEVTISNVRRLVRVTNREMLAATV